MDDPILHELTSQEPRFLFTAERWRTLGRRLGWIVVALFLFYGGLYLLRGTEWFKPQPLVIASVRLEPPPPYPLDQFMAEIRQLGQLPEELPPEEGPQFLRLTEALAKHPWIESVDYFAHNRRDDVQIHVKYRVPLLQFDQEGQRLLLTQSGLVLPWVDTLRDVPIPVKGVAFNTKLRPGDTVPLAELKPILNAGAALRFEWEHWGLNGLEIHRDGFDTTLRLLSKGGSIIIWSTLGQRRDEVGDDEKVARLRAYRKSEGSFEKPAGPYTLDLRPKSGLRRDRLR